MSSADLIRDELTRAARELGAPDTVAPVLERPRDPSFGEWTTNVAMTLAKPLKRKPQEIANDIIGKMNLKRATVGEISDAFRSVWGEYRPA
jgi:arginyl-tRNA synthetase